MSAEKHHQYVFPDDSRWDDARQSWNLAADLRPAVVVLPTTVEDVVGAVEYADRARSADRRSGHGARGHRARLARRHAAAQHARDARRRDRRARTAARGSRPVRCGRTSSSPPPSRASPRCTARRRTSASSATRSAAASAGWRASTVSRPRACSPSRSSRRTARSCAPTGRRTPTCSGRLRGGGGGLGVVVAMEIALYAVEELVAGHDDLALGAVGGGAHRGTSSGRRTHPSRSAPRVECSRSRLCRRFRRRSAAGRSSSSTGQCSGRRRRRTRSSPRSASSVPRSIPSRPSRQRRSSGCTWIPNRRCPPSVTASWSTPSTPTRSPRWSTIAGPGTDSPLIIVELRQLGGTLRERRPGAGALGSLDGSFAFFSVGVPMRPGAAEAIESRIDAIKGALAPWSRGKTYLNFAERQR